MTRVFESVADAVGGTPLFRLRALGAGLPAPVYAKAEFASIGGSVKDRAALAMIEAAERDGQLRPGGTIVEATSGNTGIGLAILGRQRGYRVVVVISDRSAREKTDILRAYGAEVITGNAGLPRQDPGHMSNVAARLAEQTPGGWLANQYDNPANPRAHEDTTGPEIWAQTGGRVTHFVAGVGTGGTISGTGRYLKQVSGGRVQVIGADPDSSVYSGGDGSPYYVESIGHFLHPGTTGDHWPDSFDPAVVDRFERIGDRESLHTARRLAREDGLLAGPSSGTAVAAALRVAAAAGPDALVVVLLPDSGRSYLSKVFSDDWMRRWGFLDDPMPGNGSPPVAALLAADGSRARPAQLPVTVPADLTVAAALQAVTAPALQPPPGCPPPAVVLVVTPRPGRRALSAAEVTGSFEPGPLAAAVAAGTVRPGDRITAHMAPPLPTAGTGQSVREVLAELGPPRTGPGTGPGTGSGPGAVLVLRDGRARAILTRDELTRAELARAELARAEPARAEPDGLSTG